MAKISASNQCMCECSDCVQVGNHVIHPHPCHSNVANAIDHPKHYTFGKIEVITVIEDWNLGFCLGNAIKYIARAPHKGNKLEDLKKAKWYLEREIQKHETNA